MKYYIYILKCDEIPFYIGKGTGRRMYIHLQNAKNSNKKSPLLDKIRKMIKNDIKIEYQKIYETDNVIDAYNKEIEQIKIIGRRNLNTGPLLNLTDGGEGVINYTWTESHRKNLSKSIKNAIKNGFNPGNNKGKSYNEEEKKIFSELNKNFFKTEIGQKRKLEMVEKWKEKLVNGKRVLSDEARKKMSEGASMGNRQRFKNKITSNPEN